MLWTVSILNTPKLRFLFRLTKTKLIWSKIEFVPGLLTHRGGGGGGGGGGANLSICTEFGLSNHFLCMRCNTPNYTLIVYYSLEV